MKLWEKYYDGNTWRVFLESDAMHGRLHELIRIATRTGRPLGGQEFVQRLEERTGKQLRRRKVGRKPTARDSQSE